jgi:hypothetical protein
MSNHLFQTLEGWDSPFNGSGHDQVGFQQGQVLQRSNSRTHGIHALLSALLWETTNLVEYSRQGQRADTEHKLALDLRSESPRQRRPAAWLFLLFVSLEKVTG